MRACASSDYHPHPQGAEAEAYVLEAHGAFADAELEAEGVLLEAAALAHAGGEGVPGLAGGDAKGVVDQDFFNGARGVPPPPRPPFPGAARRPPSRPSPRRRPLAGRTAFEDDFDESDVKKRPASNDK